MFFPESIFFESLGYVTIFLLKVQACVIIIVKNGCLIKHIVVFLVDDRLSLSCFLLLLWLLLFLLISKEFNYVLNVFEYFNLYVLAPVLLALKDSLDLNSSLHGYIYKLRLLASLGAFTGLSPIAFHFFFLLL
jgi:hypothetical protein